jgi:hypothetical protein
MPKKRLVVSPRATIFSQLPLANSLQKFIFSIMVGVCVLLGTLLAIQAWQLHAQAQFVKATNIVREPINMPPPGQFAQLVPAGAFVRSVEPIPGVSDRSIIVYITDFVFSSPLDSSVIDEIRCTEGGKYITGTYHLPEPIAGDYLNYVQDRGLVLFPLLEFSDITGIHHGQDFVINLVTHGCLNAGSMVGYYSQDQIAIIPFISEDNQRRNTFWLDSEEFGGAKGTVDFIIQPRGGGKSSAYRYVFNSDKGAFEDKTPKPEAEKEIITQEERFEVPPDLGFTYPNGGTIQTVWQFADPAVTVFTSVRKANLIYMYAYAGKNVQQLLPVTNPTAITKVAITPDKKTLLVLEKDQIGFITHAYQLPALTVIPPENSLDLTADNFFEWPLQTGNKGCVVSVKNDVSDQTIVRLAQPRAAGGYEWYPLKDSLITRTSVTKKIEQKAVDWNEAGCRAQLFVTTSEILFPQFPNMSKDYRAHSFYFSYAHGLGGADGFYDDGTPSRHLVVPTVRYKED